MASPNKKGSRKRVRPSRAKCRSATEARAATATPERPALLEAAMQYHRDRLGLQPTGVVIPKPSDVAELADEVDRSVRRVTDLRQELVEANARVESIKMRLNAEMLNHTTKNSKLEIRLRLHQSVA